MCGVHSVQFISGYWVYVCLCASWWKYVVTTVYLLLCTIVLLKIRDNIQFEVQFYLLVAHRSQPINYISLECRLLEDCCTHMNDQVWATDLFYPLNISTHLHLQMAWTLLKCAVNNECCICCQMNDVLLYTYPQQDGKYRLKNTLPLAGLKVRVFHLVSCCRNLFDF